MEDIIWILIIVFFFWEGMMVGTSMGERHIKRKIAWYIFEYRDKTVKEMFDEILSLADEDWIKANDKWK